jgi:lysozyme
MAADIAGAWPAPGITDMQISDKGLAFLERHEGIVLKAYRDVVGVWTIGAGLTAPSGVVKPRAGMVITREEASRLLGLALERNYEPAVRAEMVSERLVPAKQHEFDGAVSFHFNTGAIGRASWVKAWRRGDWQGVLKGLMAWKKGGGRVLPGLMRRREAEFRLIQNADYGEGLHTPVRPEPPKPGVTAARIAAPITAAQVPALLAAMKTLGYPVDRTAATLPLQPVLDFQRAHGLTADGIVGRATASAIRRALDARGKAKVASGGAVASIPVSAADLAAPALDIHPDLAAALNWAAPMILAAAAAYALWLAFTYRDTVAAAIDRPFPRLAAFLRSF